VSQWNFMDYDSKDTVLRVLREQADAMFDMVFETGRWEAPTACPAWQVRDVVGHLVDTTEGYFVGFDAARGKGEAAEALGLTDMARLVDEGARSFRGVPQPELVSRLRNDFDRMTGIFAELDGQEWGGLLVPHKYMGPVPAGFYAIFQLVDYAVHGWDIRDGSGHAHALPAEAADLLVPLCFVVWQSTAAVNTDTEPFEVGVRITSGANAGDSVVSVSGEGLNVQSGSVDGLPSVLEFDPAGFVLTAYGRFNGGTVRGDAAPAQRLLNLFFRI
jgi:uncharacterized protein (TIGR03083 family)